MKKTKKSRQSILEENSGYLFNRTALRMNLVMQRAINEQGYMLTIHHWAILQKLYEKDGLAQVEIANLLDKDKPNITRILDIMEKNGLVKRRPDPYDRRKYLIFLTDKGRKMEEKLTPLSIAVRKKAFRNISDRELKKFTQIIEKIYNNLD